MKKELLIVSCIMFVFCFSAIGQISFIPQQKFEDVKPIQLSKLKQTEQDSAAFELVKSYAGGAENVSEFLSQKRSQFANEPDSLKNIKKYERIAKNTDVYRDTLSIAYRVRLIKYFKNLRRLTPYTDTALLDKIEDTIKSIKTYTTYEFLSTKKPSKSFSILEVGRHNIDTLNKYIYQQADIDILQSMYTQYAGKSVSIGVEIASLLFGPLRMGVGANFQSTGDTAKDNKIKDNLQKIISNNGTFNVNLSLPLFYHRSRKERFHFSAFAQINNGINPGVDSSNSGPNYSSFYYANQSGLNLHFDLASNDQKAALAVDLPYYYAFGIAKSYEDLGIADYSILKLRLALVISGKLAFNITGPLWSSSKTLQAVPFTIGFNFSPSQILKSK